MPDTPPPVDQTPPAPVNPGDDRIEDLQIEQELQDSYLTYAMSTIMDRALPDVRDGLKPSQRRILVAMNDLNLTPGRKHIKCAKISGDTSGNYHPHGEAVIYPTLVRMAQSWNLRYKLIDGQGNFGCFTGDTHLKLLDGTERSFEDLARLGPDAMFHVYSVDKAGRIVVGQGRNVRVTRHNAPLVEVTLDDGQKIRCTPDHRFLLRNGTYKPACGLTPEDSLMAGYFDSAAGRELNAGPLVYQHATREWQPVRSLWGSADGSDNAVTPAAQHFGFPGVGNALQAGAIYNHRAVSVLRLDETADVYDITVDEHHNFLLAGGVFVHNSTDGDPPAAMRYTEARMASPMMEMLDDLNRDTVDFQPNYDERLMEPTVLPAKFPNLLVNGSTGIAVGMACNLLPHNLREICNAVVHVLDHPDCGLPELLELVPGPDFPTGGAICGRDGILEGYRTGRGRLCLRAKLKTEEQRGGRQSVIVEEIPYGVIRKSIVESVADCVKNDKIKDVSAINDESGRQYDCRIVIDLKRDADPQVVINQLYQFTPCQITVSMINIALVNRQPRTMGLKELIEHFIEHRKVVITRRTRYLLRKAQQEAHILEGKIFAVCDIDEVIRLIRSSSTREEAIRKLRERAFRIAPDHPYAAKIPANLMARVADKPVLLSQAQAEAIGALRLIQLVGLEIESLVNDYRALAEKIAEYELILSDVNRVLDIIREDVFEMKEKYGDDRRTEIQGAATDMNLEDLIAREEMVVTVSHGGYVKRQPVDTYRAQTRGGRGIKGTESKEGDFVEHLFVANTHDNLLFFTNQGRVYVRKVYDVPTGSRTSGGKSIANLLSFQPGEKIANVLAVADFDKEEQFLMFATHKGEVKKTALSAYSNIRATGIIAIGLEDGDELIGVEITDGEDQILLGTKLGMAIRFKEVDVRAMGRPAGGVRGIELEGDDEVVSLIVVPHGQDAATCMVLTACVNGFGKRTPVEDYRLIKRGGKGVINIKTTDRNGHVVGMRPVCDTDELMLITEKGILIRTPVSDIRETGRNAQGVKLIRIDEGDRLVAMAKVDVDEAVKAIKPDAAEAARDAGIGETTALEAPEGPASAGDGEAPDAEEKQGD